MTLVGLFALGAVVLRGLVFLGLLPSVPPSLSNDLVIAAIATGGGLYVSLLLGATFKVVHRPRSPRISPRTWRFWAEFFLSALPRSPSRFIDILLDDPPHA